MANPVTPTTADIKNNIIAQLEAQFSQTIPLLPKSFMRVLAGILAAVFVILYKFGGWIFLQIFVQTASDQEVTINGKTVVPLTDWGRLVGAGDPIAATQAELLIDITVTNLTGSLPSGTQLVGTQNGVTYITIGSVALSASIVQATVRAVSDQAGGGGKGTIGNLNAGDTMSFANPLANVSRVASVNSQVVTGVDAETTANYRQRVIDRFQKRPQGGAPADYEIWSEEAAGIINSYVYKSDCPGQIDVYCEADTTVDPDGIPTTAQLQDALDSINLDVSGLASRRSANALANTLAITRTAFDVQVSNLSVDNQAQVESDIDAGVKEYFLDRAPFIAGLSVLPRKDIIQSSAVIGLIHAIVDAAGGTFTSATVKEGAAVIDQRSLGIGEKSKSNTVTFI